MDLMEEWLKLILQDLLVAFFHKRKKKRRVTIEQAKEILKVEQCEE